MIQYIILTPGIEGMGGAQMYVRNKMKYLTEMGYSVDIFHSSSGQEEILINDLITYKHNRYIHLNYPAYIFNKDIQKEVILQMCKIIHHDCEKIIIETNSIACSTWGEIMAETLNAKHIIFLLSEYNSIRNRTIYDFLKYKLNRKELVGIQKSSIPLLFNKWETVDNSLSYNLKANCINVIEDIPCKLISQIPRSDFIIASIGRLNKLFLPDVIDETIAFIKMHSKKSFTFILIGGEPHNSNSQKKIVKKFQKINNAKLLITGYLFPIPQELVLLPDVFISSAGACRVSYLLGKITITIDANDHKPIGILGETTSNTVYRADEPIISLYELLDLILIKRKYESKIVKNSNDLKIDFHDHIKFIEETTNINTYFQFYSICFSLKDYIEKISLTLLGDKSLRYLSIKMLPLRNKLKITNNKLQYNL